MWLIINNTTYDLSNIEIDYNVNSNGYEYIALKRKFDNKQTLENMKYTEGQKASLLISDNIYVFNDKTISDIHYKIYTESNNIYEYIRIVFN